MKKKVSSSCFENRFNALIISLERTFIKLEYLNSLDQVFTIMLMLLFCNYSLSQSSFSNNNIFSFGGTSTEAGKSITAGNQQNLIVVGNYSGGIDVDPGIGVFNLKGFLSA
jgi:hypothetical protein